MMKWEMDISYKILSPDGFGYELASDPDGLNTIVLNYMEDDKVPERTIVISEEALPFMIEALTRHMEHLKRCKK